MFLRYQYFITISIILAAATIMYVNIIIIIIRKMPFLEVSATQFSLIHGSNKHFQPCKVRR